MLSLQDKNTKLLLLGLVAVIVVGGVYMNKKKLGQTSALLSVALTVGVALLVAMNLKEEMVSEEFYDEHDKHIEKFTEHETNPTIEAFEDESVQPRNDTALMQNSVNSKPNPVKGPGCVQMDTVSPEDLLPNADSENIWDTPANPGDISGANFLDAGYHIGVNTVGQSLRNANRQLRSEPPNPQVKVCPWNQSTIEPDTNRHPMEIGA